MLAHLLLLFIHQVVAQQTGITCSNVIPISVPRDPTLYWGTWYVLSSCANCTQPSENYCNQLKFEPKDATNVNTNLTYIASFQYGSPEGANTHVEGVLSPLNFETFDPLYRLELDFGFPVVNDFWVITTAGSNNEITAIVIVSCYLTGTDQQIFFLSRKPYFVPPVTFDTLVSQVRRAITNYDEFIIVPTVQAQGWCDYQFSETSSDSGKQCDDDVDEMQVKLAAIFAIAATFLSFIILSFLLALKFFPQFCNRSSSAKNELLTSM